MNEIEERLKAFEDRAKERKPKSDEEQRLIEEQRQESLRQDYLKRTGRKELKP